MLKKNFWKTEYSVTLLALFTAVLLFMPISIRNTSQAIYISKWNEWYNRIDYMFSVINTHISDDIIKSFDKAKTSAEKEMIILALIKPYLRVDMDKRPPKRYKPRYMNNSRVFKGQLYYFDEFYFADSNSIVGIKDLKNTKIGEPMFEMMIDINGLIPPNRWGKDVFGINIYEDGRIEAFGNDLDMDDLRKDCSLMGSGVSCSYYYKIGGGFEE